MRHTTHSTKLAAALLAMLLLISIVGSGSATVSVGTASTYSLVLTRTLSQGSTGSDVRALQTVLKQLGYLTGSVDGIFGPKTKAAVEGFQRKNGLTVNGQVTNATFQRMISNSAIPNTGSGSGGSTIVISRTLKYGDSGSDVLSMQQALKALGYYSGPLSGNFQDQTLAAVRLFQNRNGLTVDGLAGRITLTLLYSGKALPYYNVTPVPTYRPTAQPTAQPTQSQRILRYGMYGDDVAAVQSRLYQLGYYTGTINGWFDQATLNAVAAFQARNSLYADGEVGPLTMSRLFSNSAIPNGKPNPTQPPSYQLKTPDNVSFSSTAVAGSLSWGRVQNATGYQLELSIAGITRTYSITSGSTTYFSIPGDLYIPGATLNYRLRATGQNGSVSPWNNGSIKIPSYSPPPVITAPPITISAPGNLGFSSTGTAGTMTWGQVNGAIGYDIRLTIAGVTKDYSVNNGSTTSFPIPSDMYLPGNVLSFGIRARGQNGVVSNWVNDSIPIPGFVPPPVITAEPPPQMTMPTGIGLKDSNIVWNTVQGAQQYYVEVVGNGFYYDVVSASPSISISNYTALSSGTSFNVHVTPKANGVNGPTAIQTLTMP
ncbi:hypothetical protein AGMMS49992_08510 [Clostridia bacterium]|nr:hypothetical protein AGMMS49992_08510 [Clostridia bacterium]